jgi:hypothetical protein
MTPEHNIQNQIRSALSPYAVIFRANVGSAYTQDGRYFSTGLPKGFSDLFGFRRSDGKMIFIEVKTPKGRIRPEQEEFIKNMNACGAIAGVCRSPDDALRLIGTGKNNG